MLTTGNLKVVWQYSSDTVPYFSTKTAKPTKLSIRHAVTKTVSRARDITTCSVLRDDVVVAQADVVRGWTDKQCYETARKLSLKRACECITLDSTPTEHVSVITKDERKAIWEAYRVSTKVPRWNVSK